MPRRGINPGQCTVCRHASRVRIDFLLASGAPKDPLGKKFGLSGDALTRHFARHVSEDFKRSTKIGPFQSEEHLRKLCAEGGVSVLENLRAVHSGLAGRWLVAYE